MSNRNNSFESSSFNLTSSFFDNDKIKVLSWSPRIFYYSGILTPEDCDHIIKLGIDKVKRSLVVGPDGKPVQSIARTSDGAFLSKERDDPVIKTLAEKIALWTQLPVDNGEDFYILRYQNGQEYKAHNDYFTITPNRPHDIIGSVGNRYATVLTYLSDVEEGGETYFPQINLKVPPKKGDAILFWNMNPNGSVDPKTLHAGLPVIKGTKWCLTKWIRQFSYKK